MGWTEERVELLKKLWLEGLSASQIAGVLGEGVTRNAVIGKVHRLKLSGRAKPASSAPRARTAPRPRAASRRQPFGRRRRPWRGGGGIGSMMKSRTDGGGGGRSRRRHRAEDHPKNSTSRSTWRPQVQELFIPVEKRLSLLQLNEAHLQVADRRPADARTSTSAASHSEEGKPYCEFHSRRAYHQLDKKRR